MPRPELKRQSSIRQPQRGGVRLPVKLLTQLDLEELKKKAGFLSRLGLTKVKVFLKYVTHNAACAHRPLPRLSPRLV